MSAAGPRAAIVIPVFDHFDTAAAVVRAAVATGLPVFVVDDGSTDPRAGELDAVDGITLLRHPQNRGKGAALRTGLAAAARVVDWAVTVDADGQHDPARARVLLAALRPGERTIVVGCRQNMDDANVRWASRMGRSFSNFWVRCAGGPAVADSQSGFRLYPLPETLALGASACRFQFEVEVLVRARWAGLPVREVPVPVHYDPPERRISHFRPFVDFWRNSGTFARLITCRILVPRARRARRARRALPPHAGA